MKFKYILFDLDGTITESGPGIMNSVAYALEKMGYEEKDREKLKRFIGPPLTDSMMKYYGMSEEDAAKAVRYYREYYTEKGIFENSVYDGFDESIKRLKEQGIIILLSVIITCIFYMKDYPKIIPVLFLTVGFGIIGFLDDYLKVVLRRSDGLLAWQKMLLQIVVTAIFAVYFGERELKSLILQRPRPETST